jgi:hypothetical protein
LAAAAAITLLVPLLPLAALSVSFAGFTDGTPDFWTPYSMAALVPWLAMLAVAAVMALRRAAPPGQRARALGLGFVTSLACAGALVGLDKLLEASDRARLATVERNDAAAKALVARIAECARSFAAAHPERGYPADLVSLGPRGSGCLPEQAETQGGFRFVYLASPPDREGRRPSFSACGRPLHYRESGAQTFVADSTGRTPEPLGLSSTDTEAVECVVRWHAYAEMGSSLLYCLLSYAASHPDRGFPRRSDEVSECKRPDWTLDRWSYQPGSQGPDGRIVSYQVRWSDIGGTAYVTDETGTLRVVR